MTLPSADRRWKWQSVRLPTAGPRPEPDAVSSRRVRSGTRRAAGAGLLAGALFAGLAALAGGPVAGGRLFAVGPSPWRVGLAAGAELAAVAAAVAYVRLRLPREFVASLPPSVRSLLRRGRRRG